MKTRKSRRGGTKLSPEERRSLSQFNLRFMTHDDFRRIGPCKPVATSKSGTGESTFFKAAWHRMTPRTIDMLIDNVRETRGFSLGARVKHPDADDDPHFVNPVVFYSVEHLSALADIYGKSVNEVLDIINSGSRKTREEMDIILIAFGDASAAVPLSKMGRINRQLYFNEIGIDEATCSYDEFSSEE